MSTKEQTPSSGDGSRTYDSLRDIMSQRTVAKNIPYLIEHIKPTDRILDVGCGVGSITIGLAQLVPQGHVVGMDVGETEIAMARDAAAEQGIKNVEFKTGDAHKLLETFGEGSFDIVHAHMVLMHLTEQVTVLRSMRQLTRPGGLVASTDMAEMLYYPPLSALDKQKEIWYKSCESRGIVPNGGRLNHVWAHEAGFEWSQIQLGTSSQQWFGESMKQWARGACNATQNFLKSGLLTAEECTRIEASYEDWAAKPESRVMGLDGWVLCQN